MAPKSHVENVPIHVTTSALVGILLGGAFFLVSLVAVTCFCYRRRGKPQDTKKPLVLRKPTAPVRSPTGPPALAPVVRRSPSTPPKDAASSPQQEHPHHHKSLVEGENEKLKMMKQEKEGDNKEKEVLVEKPGKLGQLHFRLKYNPDRLSLQVSIVRCSDLPPKNNGSSDPYVKLQLLPEKQHKVKTRVLRKTVDPVYDEDFTFYGIGPNQLPATTLHFVVLSFDRYSRDDVIGEVICPLAGLTPTAEEPLQLTKEITPRNLKIRYQGRGELLVSLCYQPAANRLTVVVLKARNLPKMDFAGLCDPYVKIYLLYNQQRIAKKKTHVKKRTTSPVFNESFVFEVPYNEGLDNISLEFLVLDWDRVTKNEVIGRLELGPHHQHWNEVCGAPRRQIAEWHKLKE